MKKMTERARSGLSMLCGMLACLFLCFPARGQLSTVVIGEVMYDHPLYDNEPLAPGLEGEFMSLYNYGEEEVDISGWRIMVVSLATANRVQYGYRFPANTVLAASGLVVIASRKPLSVFDVGRFYGQELPDSAGVGVLYTSTMAYPDTKSRVVLYDERNQVQDMLVYDGMSAAAPGEAFLRATNMVDSDRPLKETASIRRERIVEEEGVRVISRDDYLLADSGNTVLLFNYLPVEYSYTSPSSLIKMWLSEDLRLDGSQTGNNDYRGRNIVSSQVIERGKTVYWAEEEITMGPGFEVKAGAEFEAGVMRDSVHLVSFMTYNLKGRSNHYVKHAQLVKNSKADVVAIQELRGDRKYKILKEESGYSAKWVRTIADYGIAMMWNPESVGEPLWIWSRLVSTYDKWSEICRAFIVAEFWDFCFVSTHLSLEKSGRKRMAELILDNKIVKDCKNKGKPVYIAGDMNEKLGSDDSKAIPKFREKGFEILNNTEKVPDTEKYVDSTQKGGNMIDLILEYNTNPYHKTINRGVPMNKEEREQFFEDKISDHLPYFVKVKIR